jgi:hypothetical protein
MTSTQSTVSDSDIFFFDLRGFLHLEQALSAAEVAALNAILDSAPALEPGQWWGHVNAHSYRDTDGLNLQQIYEAGEPFEALIDHPSWFERVKHFVGGQGTFDAHHGPLFIDEDFANLRGPGQAIGMHSGGHHHVIRNQFRVVDGKFHCGQVNVLIALTDIGPGDGGTVLIPGSHKSNFPHPDLETYQMRGTRAGDIPEGGFEVSMQAGDALLFVDTICHGSARRANEGQRRTVVYRYGPSWGTFRHNYQVSEDLLARLTPERRQIVRPRSGWPPE